jgi:hypothetical protein
MSFTNNKNFIGNYDLEQSALKKQEEYLLFRNASNGVATSTYFPGNGLLQGRVAPLPLTDFSCDIESFLYGIGSSNLVKERTNIYNNLDIKKEAEFIKNTKSLNIIDNYSKYGVSTNTKRTNITYCNKVFTPSPLTMEKDARPLIK